MKFRYCRIQGKELAANTKTGKGVFSMLYQMADAGVMTEEDKGLFLEIDSWFAEVLPFPPQCRLFPALCRCFLPVSRRCRPQGELSCRRCPGCCPFRSRRAEAGRCRRIFLRRRP